MSKRGKSCKICKKKDALKTYHMANISYNKDFEIVLMKTQENLR